MYLETGGKSHGNYPHHRRVALPVRRRRLLLEQQARAIVGTAFTSLTGAPSQDSEKKNGITMTEYVGAIEKLALKINASKTAPVQLYTIYSPPNHPEGTVHRTKAEAAELSHAFAERNTP
jgi:hypothetical protein